MGLEMASQEKWCVIIVESGDGEELGRRVGAGRLIENLNVDHY